MFKDKLRFDKIKNWALGIIFFAYFFIDLFPSSYLRNSPIYIIISSSVITFLALIFIFINKNFSCIISAFLLTLCVWSRIIPNARNIYMLLILVFSIFATIVSSKLICSRRHTPISNDFDIYLFLGGIFGFLLFFGEVLKITLFQTEPLHWGLIIAAAILAIIVTVILIIGIIKKDNEKEFGWKLLPMLLFAFLLLTFLFYISLINVNFTFDYQKPNHVSARVVKVEHRPGGYKSFSYEKMTVMVDGKEYELKINVHDAEEFSKGDQVTLEISKGLFGVEYYHCDKDIQSANS